MKNGLLQHANPWQKVLYYIVFFFVATIVASLIARILCQYVFQIEITEDVLNDLTRIDVIRLNKILNFLTHIFIFIIPPIVFAKLISFQPKEIYLGTPPNKRVWLSFPFLFIGLTILNGVFYWVNHQIDFSGISQEFQDSLIYEQALREKTIYAYVGETWQSYFVNLFLIALIPALGEELTFRGILQNLFSKATQNIYLGISLSALLFAFIHFQPFNFLPIFVLGMAYGFIVAYTGSIWLTIALHFANNALQVTMMHLERIGYNFPETSIFIDLGLLALCTGLVYWFVKKNPPIARWHETKGNYFR